VKQAANWRRTPIGRWREDEIREGQVFRVRKYQELGSKADFPSRRLALRELGNRISPINDPSYRARAVSSFASFAERWQKIVLVQHKPSTQSTIQSHIKKYLVPHFGQLQLRDIQPEGIQRFIAGINKSPKTVRNIFVTLQLMWKSTRAWQYVSHNALDGVVLPKPCKARRFSLTKEEIVKILAVAPEPYRTFYWLAAETGMRAGELCGLRVDDIDFKRGLVNVRQSAWHGKLQEPKTVNAVRTFAVSTRLLNHFHGILQTWRPNAQQLVFATRNGTPWDANLREKKIPSNASSTENSRMWSARFSSCERESHGRSGGSDESTPAASWPQRFASDHGRLYAHGQRG